MNKSPVKKVKMMDIVRKNSAREEVNPLLGKGQREKFASERKKESLHIEVQQEIKRPTGYGAVKSTVSEQQPEKQELKPAVPVEHKKEEVPEAHIPEMSSLEMDHPIAYIPKEKPSKEEKRMLERVERRERTNEKEKKEGWVRRVVMWIIICMLVAGAAYVIVAVLPRAEMVLVVKTVEWPQSGQYANVIGASTKIAEVDPISRQIPVAVFLEKKTNVFQFPATGSEKSIERKAVGRVTLYNEFGESSQPLVAGTRLETPDGKLFRLRDRVVVPGATKSGGELIPASIEADVIADKAGESYNIDPVARFSIPGFAGTAKFNAFYAESKSPMTGGFVGEGKYPTAEDIKMAKESAERQMKEVVESFLDALVLDGFKIIEGSRKYTVIKEVVDETVDGQGNFSLYMEAEGGIDALKEEYVIELMTALAQQVHGDGYAIKEHSISYGDIVVDARTGAISLPVDFRGIFWKPMDLNAFKGKIMGKTQDELKTIVFGSDTLEKADVSLWPFWVGRVPNDPDRVKVELK